MRPAAIRLVWSIPLLLGVIFVGVVMWSRTREAARPVLETEPAKSAAASTDTAPPPSAPPSSGGAEPRPALTLMPTAIELDEALRRRDDPQETLRAVEQLILFYRRAFGENPVGQNEDITAAIVGENPGHAAFLPAGTPVIREGKLIDPWGTPYWFHPVSSRQMEIRSAGPDRDLFTADDLTLD